MKVRTFIDLNAKGKRQTKRVYTESASRVQASEATI